MIHSMNAQSIDIGENTSFNGQKFNQVDYNWGEGTKWSFTVGSGTSSDNTFDAFVNLYNATVSAVLGTNNEFNEDNYSYLISRNMGSPGNWGINEHLNAMTKFIQKTGLAIERLQHKEDMIRSQITANEAVQSNYEDADFAKEQMELIVQILQH